MMKKLVYIPVFFSLVASLLLPARALAQGERYNLIDRDTVTAEQGIYSSVQSVTFKRLPQQTDPVVFSPVPAIECQGVKTLPRIEMPRAAHEGTTGSFEARLVPDADTSACGQPDSSILITRAASANPTPTANTATGRAEVKGDCDAGPLSWAFCSLFEWIVEGIEGIETKFIIPFLKIEPLSTDTSSTTYEIWRQFRILANLGFVLAFLFITFANITSIGIDYYTVKKTLPRLVVASILVQFSYWIVGFAIDVSNVVGNGLGDLILAPIKGQANYNITELTGGLGIAGLLLALFATVGSILSGGIFIIAIGAFFAVIAVFFTLVLRQILVTFLLIVSPLAFVAMILPNTESWFRRWRKALIQVLLMYPLIVLLFASGKIFGAAAATARGGGVVNEEFRSVLSVVANIIPLFLIPATFKFAGEVLLGAAKIIDVLDDLGKTRTQKAGAYDRLKKRVDQRRVELAAGQGVNFGRFNIGRRASVFGRGAFSAPTHLTKKGKSANDVRAMADFARDRSDWGKRLEEESLTFEAYEVLSRGLQWGQNKVNTATDAVTADRYRDGIQRASRYHNITAARAAAALWLGDKAAIGDDDRQALLNYTQPTKAGALIRRQVWDQAKQGARKTSVHLAYTDITTGQLDRGGLKSYVVTQNLGTWAGYSKKAFEVMRDENILYEMATQNYQQRELLKNLLGPRGAAPEQQAIIRAILQQTVNQAPPPPPPI
jgi:hypothetical protein